MTCIKLSENAVHFLSKRTVSVECLQKLKILPLTIACCQTRTCLQTQSVRISEPNTKYQEDLWCHTSRKRKILKRKKKNQNLTEATQRLCQVALQVPT